MKIVVTGGTGFVGKSLVSRLATEGHDVVVLTRNPSKVQFREKVRIKEWDGKSQGSWSSSVDGADAVINLAGELIGGKRWTAKQKERILTSRINATAAIVTAIEHAQNKPEVLISASAVGYYGPVKDGEVAENYPRGNSFLSEVTQQWERAAQKAGQSGVRVVLNRTAVVLGEGSIALERMLLPFRMFVGGPIGSGKQWFPWIHIDDLIGVILFALTNRSISGVVNAVAPGIVTMKEFCSVLGKVTRRPSWAPVPGVLLKIAFGEMSVVLLTGQRVVPQVLEKHGFQFKFPIVSSALSDILA